MPLSPALAARLRDQGHDAVHAAEVGLDHSSDHDIISFAKREQRQSSPPTSTIRDCLRLLAPTIQV
jgi:hypothetical protein